MDVDPVDGAAEWIRYRCPLCSAESVWHGPSISSAHYRAVYRGHSEIRWEDQGLVMVHDGTGENKPLDWKELA